MKQGNYISPIFKLSLRDAEAVPRKISYSQWATYEQCPRKWKLTYIDKLDSYTDSIETTFGTAFHETLQHYLKIMLHFYITSRIMLGILSLHYQELQLTSR